MSQAGYLHPDVIDAYSVDVSRSGPGASPQARPDVPPTGRRPVSPPIGMSDGSCRFPQATGPVPCLTGPFRRPFSTALADLPGSERRRERCGRRPSVSGCRGLSCGVLSQRVARVGAPGGVRTSGFTPGVVGTVSPPRKGSHGARGVTEGSNAALPDTPGSRDASGAPIRDQSRFIFSRRGSTLWVMLTRAAISCVLSWSMKASRTMARCDGAAALMACLP